MAETDLRMASPEGGDAHYYLNATGSPHEVILRVDYTPTVQVGVIGTGLMQELEFVPAPDNEPLQRDTDTVYDYELLKIRPGYMFMNTGHTVKAHSLEAELNERYGQGTVRILEDGDTFSVTNSFPMPDQVQVVSELRIEHLLDIVGDMYAREMCGVVTDKIAAVLEHVPADQQQAVIEAMATVDRNAGTPEITEIPMVGLDSLLQMVNAELRTICTPKTAMLELMGRLSRAELTEYENLVVSNISIRNSILDGAHAIVEGLPYLANRRVYQEVAHHLALYKDTIAQIEAIRAGWDETDGHPSIAASA